MQDEQKQKIEECELKSAKIEAVGRGENGMSYFVVKNVGIHYERR